jgi:hypothetical protein
VPGDLPKDVDRDPGVSHPGEPGVTKIVPTQMLIAELRHHLVPVRRIPQDRRGDAAAPWGR